VFPYDSVALTPPTADEIDFFETNGYLALEDFLDSGHVAHLTDRLAETDGNTHIDGENTRIFRLAARPPWNRGFI